MDPTGRGKKITTANDSSLGDTWLEITWFSLSKVM